MARDVSSLHVLFPPAPEAALLQGQGMMLQAHGPVPLAERPGDGYADFDDFLGRMTRHRRKVIRQERRRVREAGRARSAGCAARRSSAKHWEFFERCYRRTYAAHRSSPYLNLEFFLRIGATLPRALPDDPRRARGQAGRGDA